MATTFVKHQESGKMVQIIEDQAAMISELAAVGVKIGKTSLKELIAGKRETVSGCVIVSMHEDGTEQPAEVKQESKQLTPEPTEVKTAAVKTPRVKATIKAVDPKGKIKPVRKGTKIAKGLELLLKGATMEQLQAAHDDIGDDPVDFCNRRVTKRGYGIKVDDGQFFLVTQNHQNGQITYTASEADSAETSAD